MPPPSKNPKIPPPSKNPKNDFFATDDHFRAWAVKRGYGVSAVNINAANRLNKYQKAILNALDADDIDVLDAGCECTCGTCTDNKPLAAGLKNKGHGKPQHCRALSAQRLRGGFGLFKALIHANNTTRICELLKEAGFTSTDITNFQLCVWIHKDK